MAPTGLYRLAHRVAEILARTSVRQLDDTWAQGGEQPPLAQRVGEPGPTHPGRQTLGLLAHRAPTSRGAGAYQHKLLLSVVSADRRTQVVKRTAVPENSSPRGTVAGEMLSAVASGVVGGGSRGMMRGGCTGGRLRS